MCYHFDLAYKCTNGEQTKQKKQTELQQYMYLVLQQHRVIKTGGRFHDKKVRILLMNSKLSKIADNRYASNGGESLDSHYP